MDLVQGLGRALWCALAITLAGCASKPIGVVAEVQGSGATQLAQQLARLDTPAVAGPRTIFIGAALNGREDVFDRDIRAFDRQLAHTFGTRYRAVLLSNLRVAGSPRALPLATIEHLDEVFDTLERQRRPDDRYIVLLTTHGHKGLLEVEQAALWRSSKLLVSAKLGHWARQLAPQPTWWVVSACFSGSHLPALRQDHLLVMTASNADKPSFGCNDKEENTWFVRELLAAHQAAPEQPLLGLWQRTLAGVSAAEQRLKLAPSYPQIQIGQKVSPHVDQPLRGF